MENSLIEKFQELIEYVATRRTEATMAFRRLNTDIKKAKKLRECFESIKEFMDNLLEDYTVSGDHDDHREEEKKDMMNQSQVEEDKNPQDKNSDMVTKEDLTTVKKEILNFIQRKLVMPQPQVIDIQPVINAITQSEANIGQNLNTVGESVNKKLEQLINNNNENKQSLFKIESTVNRIIPNNEPVNLKSLSEQMISVQAKMYLKLSEQKGIIENTAKNQNSAISDLSKYKDNLFNQLMCNSQQLKEHDNNIKEQLISIKQSIEQLTEVKPLKQVELTQENMVLVDIQRDAYILLQTPTLVQQFQCSCERGIILIICHNNNIVVGGSYAFGSGNLQLYQSDGKIITNRDFEGSCIFCGIAIKDQLYINVDYSITILDQLTLATIKQIKIQSYAIKLYLNNDILFVGQEDGYFDIINVITNATIKQCKLFKYDIIDIINIHDNEYAFASGNGLYIYNIDNDYCIDDNYIEYYKQDQIVHTIQYINHNMLVAGVYNNRLQIINRQEKKVIKQIDGFDGKYCSIQRIIGYDENNYPYLIIKDRSNITILNTHAFEIMQTIKCQYSQYMNDSLVQKQIGNEIFAFTLQKGQLGDYYIQKYIIAIANQ